MRGGGGGGVETAGFRLDSLQCLILKDCNSPGSFRRRVLNVNIIDLEM